MIIGEEEVVDKAFEESETMRYIVCSAIVKDKGCGVCRAWIVGCGDEVFERVEQREGGDEEGETPERVRMERVEDGEDA